MSSWIFALVQKCFRSQERVSVFWEANPEDHKICNNHQCALHLRLIRIAVVEMEDFLQPVVNLVRTNHVVFDLFPTEVVHAMQNVNLLFA